MHHSPETLQDNSYQRRRQSTLVFSITKLDGSLGGPDSPPTSLSQNRSLMPPSSPAAHSSRNSFGFWGGSKSASSTPNLGNAAGNNNDSTPDDLSSSSITTVSASAALTQTQGSGEPSVGSVDSSNSSFHQRRKRSESTGGLKNTAGNISRIVKKSSSNFLKKFVKSFDDKDAPPIPVVPASNNASSIKSPPLSTKSTNSHDMFSQPSILHSGLIGPLDTPPPLSPLLGQELEYRFTSLDSSLPPLGSQVKQNQAVEGSNVESWLNDTDPGFSPAALSASLAALSQERAQLDRRRSRGPNDLDDDEEEDVDEDEDEDLPISISNRLSKLYEAGSMHLNQSQTSLYYSTKSNLSDSEEAASRRTSLAQDALGYSLGLSRGNSIRFSQYSIGNLHLVPLTTSASNPSSPGLPKSPMEYPDGRQIPRRPVSMFVPSTITAAERDDEEARALGGSAEANHAHGLSTHTAATPSSSMAATPSSPILTPREYGRRSKEGPRSAALRPITICVGPEDANNHPLASNSTMALLTPDMSQEEQQDATAALALRTAKRCYDEDEGFLKRSEIAEYLGAPKSFNRLVLTHYMDCFNFTSKRLDMAFRALCQKLVLKGETQEVDRILEVFAERYVTCNPKSLLGGADNAKDIVHAITYSILLLNTDLHIVQQSSKMSRSAFVKNTLHTVQSQASQSQSCHGEDSFESLGLQRSVTGESLPEGGGSSISSKKPTPSIRSWKSGQSHQATGSGQAFNGHHHQQFSNKKGTDAKANGGYGNGKLWLQEVEGMLKDIYTAVKQHQILLPLSPATLSPPRSKSIVSLSSPPTSPTISGFGSSIFSSNRMSRLIYPSSSSPALQDSGGGFGLGLSGRRSSVSARTKQLRSDAIQRLNAQAHAQQSGVDSDRLFVSAPSSASTNANHRLSMVGPFMSDSYLLDLANSNNNRERDLGLGQSQHSSSSRLSSLTMATSQTGISTSTSITTPSASQNSLISLQSHATTTPSSQEDHQQPHKKHHSADQQQEDYARLQKSQLHQQHIEARYRMEGILWRKHLLERTDKKAQHRAWRQLLVVVDTDQGTLSMFRSDSNIPKLPPPSYGRQRRSNSLSMSSPSPLGDVEADVPLFDEILLQHTITNILPPPGYSSSRRHVFAVQLHTGAVYLFQTSTPQECEAWTRTCNYWAARTSKEPLVGGVVNMEYGWGRALETLARHEEEQQQQAPEGGRATPSSDTSQSSSHTRGGTGAASIRMDPSAGMKLGMDYLSGPPDVFGDMNGGSSFRSGSSFGDTASLGRGRSPSIRSGTRGSFSSSTGGVAVSGGSGGGTSLGDSITLFEWSAPVPTMTVSAVTEEEQMLALRKYVAGLEADMEAHQEYRTPMTRLFPPKSNNYAKAFNNWERRSRYLLKEMVKYQIYVECLEQSIQFQQQLQLELERVQQLQMLERQGWGQDQELGQEFGDQQHLQAGQRTEDDLEVELAQLVVREGPV
ncbi:hypothetical protein BC939DRAFT_467570 [Gamsiella multidivaricata]|uniref:uncharacterized protein n=1 Tax=Gamsiella multidivaricata TaxID=101098 RepID=UPI00221F908F|nr:uncharacterized protein BC939DRAFT_467570 [Gamsiella multidivaricata]KAI7816851.1 hypothetical protein BC939DRAFT_467570 [Gamsiella multidivaricata]